MLSKQSSYFVQDRSSGGAITVWHSYFQGIRISACSGTGKSSLALFYQYPPSPWKVPVHVVQGWALHQLCITRALALLSSSTEAPEFPAQDCCWSSRSDKNTLVTVQQSTPKPGRVPGQKCHDSGLLVWGQAERQRKASGFKQGREGLPTKPLLK